MVETQIICDNVIHWAANYDGPKFHAMLCDPPYHLHGGMTKPRPDLVSYDDGKGNPYARIQSRLPSGGFMGQAWDGGGIAFQPETWAALAEHLLPGAFGMAFASSRGWHRLAVAIEDAGLRIHPSIFGWSYGCLSEDTEILTMDGWKSYRDNLTGSMVMCYNIEDDTLSFMPAQETFRYEISDIAYRIQSDNTDQIVTRDHRCIVERGGKLEFRQAASLECQETIPILESLPNVPTALRSDECRRVLQKEPLFTEMCNGDVKAQAYRQEARASEGQNWLLSEAQAKGQNNHLSNLWGNEVQACCMVTKSQGDPNVFPEMPKQISSTKPGRIGASSQNSQFGTRWLDRRQHEKLFEQDDRLRQPSLERRRDLFSEEGQLRCIPDQVRALPRGISRNGPQGRVHNGASTVSGSGNGQAAESRRGGTPQRPQPREQQPGQPDALCQQQPTQEIRRERQYSTTLATVTPIHYEGNVWCVRVPTGAFVARRKGRVFITGNSGFPKASRIGERVRDDNGKLKLIEDERFAGHRYGLQALKPALEPIIVFQKPYDGKLVDSITATGAGALNIDGARLQSVVLSSERRTCNTGSSDYGIKLGLQKDRLPLYNGERHNPQGRWPANFCLVHHPECERVGTERVRAGGGPTGGGESRKDGITYSMGDIRSNVDHRVDGLETVAAWDCHPDCAVRKLGEQSAGTRADKPSASGPNSKESMFTRGNNKQYAKYVDKGTAARFFFQADWSYEMAERLANADPVRYQAKASRKERDAGLEGMALRECAAISGKDSRQGGRRSDGARQNSSGHPMARNPHPTVKPIALLKWLATLLSPPPEYAPRRLYVPFCGSGSELIGAMLSGGFEEIVGIEMSTEYVEIAEARLKYWAARPKQLNLTNIPK